MRKILDSIFLHIHLHILLDPHSPEWGTRYYQFGHILFKQFFFKLQWLCYSHQKNKKRQKERETESVRER